MNHRLMRSVKPVSAAAAPHSGTPAPMPSASNNAPPKPSASAAAIWTTRIKTSDNAARRGEVSARLVRGETTAGGPFSSTIPIVPLIAAAAPRKPVMLFSAATMVQSAKPSTSIALKIAQATKSGDIRISPKAHRGGAWPAPTQRLQNIINDKRHDGSRRLTPRIP